MQSNKDFDLEYLRFLQFIVENGEQKGDRTGTGTYSTFGPQLHCPIDDFRLPLITTKKLFNRSYIHETIWFLSGSTNIKYLKDNNVSIWDSWVKPETAVYDADGKLLEGDIGSGAYGACWRKWDDTRLINKEELGGYIERGFSAIDTTVNSGKIVVNRTIDQMADLINMLKTNPESRRLIITAWNPALIDETVLPPCHSFMQWYTHELTLGERLRLLDEAEIDNVSEIAIENAETDEEFKTALMQKLNKMDVPKYGLHCKLTQRSADTCLGVPFNIAQYSLLIHMVAHVVNMVGCSFIWSAGDAHIYKNHIEPLTEQMLNRPKDINPTVRFKRKVDSIDDFTFDDIEIVGYDSHDKIEYPVAV